MRFDHSVPGLKQLDPITLAQGVVRNPSFAGIVRRGLRLRDAAQHTQETILGALNLPTADELNTVAGRLRSISQRLELLEDALDRVERSVAQLPARIEADRARL